MTQKIANVSPRRVLIVDDNVSLAENIAEILQIDGHFTEIAESAEEALAMASENAPDVLVTDYRLPGISGAVLVRRLDQTRGRVPTLVISAYTDDRTVNEVRDAGATFMAKPVDFVLLSNFVREGSA